jgi:glycerol-1-phosphate dehydrogenase [NAD(P)+]
MTISRALVDTALAAATDTRHLTVEPGALASVAAAYTATCGSRTAVVVADTTTWGVAGQRVDGLLRAAGVAVLPPIVLPLPLHADYEHVLSLESRLAADDATPVAVGSGTINDLTKLAAHRRGRPYMVVATAASMDGYAAFGASITRDGFKQTMACAAPAAIVADLEIVAAAPTPLTAAGYGDLIGKVPAGADWLLADALDLEPIDAAAWAMVQHPLRAALGAPDRLRDHDQDATGAFFLGLVMSGLAMQATHSSRPASGAEHLISHLWEMTGLTHHGQSPSHGTKVGIGAVLVTMLYERLLPLDLLRIEADAAVAVLPSAAALEAAVRAALPAGEIADRAVVESLAKHPTTDQLRTRLRLLQERWPALRARIREQLLPSDELRRMLGTLRAAGSPAEIGVSAVKLHADLLTARLIRRRYTVLDLAAELGLLDGLCVDIVWALCPPARATAEGTSRPKAAG